MKPLAISIVLLLAPPALQAQQPCPDGTTPKPGEPLIYIDGIRVCNQAQPPGTPAPGGDPFARYLFPPELVMAHQRAIGLTDRQRAAIQEEMRAAQVKFVDLQFKMSGEGEKLQQLLRGTSIEESPVLEQVDQVLAIEREVKRLQLSLMIRIKNQLTESQQTTLANLRRQFPGDRTLRLEEKRPPDD